MAGAEQRLEVLPKLWQLLRNLVTRGYEELRHIRLRRLGAGDFPWIERSAANTIVGGLLTIALDRVFHLGMDALIPGAIATVSGVVWLALRREPVMRESGASSVAREIALWDPWLDESNVSEESQTPESLLELDREDGDVQAHVRPRVYSSESGEALPLEAVIGPILAANDYGAVRVSGPDGSGKTVALNHLAVRVPPYMRVTFLDCPDPLAVAAAASEGLVVFASNQPSPKVLADLKLAPWGRDEWIEYLLARNRRHCASVMGRLARCVVQGDLLEGIPEIWRIVLDHMAADGSIDDPRQALRREFARRMTDGDLRGLVEGDCLAALIIRGQSEIHRIECLRRHSPEKSLWRLIRHRPIQLVLAADHIADALVQDLECRALADPFPRDLVREAALRITECPEAVEHLQRLLAGPDEAIYPMAASLMHALRIGWKPSRQAPCLKGAYLQDAPWAAVALADADMRDVDLSRSDLRGAQLDRARLEDARLSSSDLRTASLCGAQLRGADLRRARLAVTRAEDGHFDCAQLSEADLEGAHLDRATLREADLRDANLVGTSLVGADLTRAKVDGADFSAADLSGAVLRGLALTAARLEGARFRSADLSHSDLEGMVLPRADFSSANLSQALLTGSSMPNANFRGASLRAAGLAEVEWERADLRGADLREAAFHLGSSRSGLVGSTIACEGSRTGFYTDDYNEQDFKSPEEIRKANLVGVDLRGAKIDGVDFYLVDLRGAQIDPEHIPHLCRCGAILESRV
jgi:uncharacterized protein YjbI with pentapeptide repeats